MAHITPRTQGNECRQCSAFCDRVIDPTSCVSANCSALYTYDDPVMRRRYMGCLHKVFGVEIDVELFRESLSGRGGFGVVKVTGVPLRQCAFSVERAYHGDGDAFRCVNRRFFDAPDSAPDAVRAFDLRDRL